MTRFAARATLLCAVSVWGLLLAAGTSQGAVTIGSDLKATPAVAYGLPNDSTFSSPTIPGRETFSPIDGVIHSWRISSLDLEQPGTLRLRVIRGNFGVGSSPIVTALSGTVESFTIGPQGLPIGAGDGIGVDNGAGDLSGVQLFAGTTGATVNVWSPFLADGESRIPTTSASSVEVLVAADVEPDADGDRFGDETRDSCPGQTGPLGGCPSPEPVVSPPTEVPPLPVPQTRIVKSQKRIVARKGGASARFRFTSSEAGATFQCALRKKGRKLSRRERRLRRMTACRSPKTYKRLLPGAYVFLVRAIGTAGPDPSPAKDPFRVVQR